MISRGMRQSLSLAVQDSFQFSLNFYSVSFLKKLCGLSLLYSILRTGDLDIRIFQVCPGRP